MVRNFKQVYISILRSQNQVLCHLIRVSQRISYVLILDLRYDPVPQNPKSSFVILQLISFSGLKFHGGFTGTLIVKKEEAIGTGSELCRVL